MFQRRVYTEVVWTGSIGGRAARFAQRLLCYTDRCGSARWSTRRVGWASRLVVVLPVRSVAAASVPVALKLGTTHFGEVPGSQGTVSLPLVASALGGNGLRLPPRALAIRSWATEVVPYLVYRGEKSFRLSGMWTQHSSALPLECTGTTGSGMAGMDCPAR